jgi:hypothetical protein
MNKSFRIMKNLQMFCVEKYEPEHNTYTHENVIKGKIKYLHKTFILTKFRVEFGDWFIITKFVEKIRVEG